MAWHLPLGEQAILVLAVAVVALIGALLRRDLAPANERGPGEGGALAARDPQQEVDARAATAARAEAERVGAPAAAAPAALPASSDSPRQALQPHRSNGPILRQPGDARFEELKDHLLEELKLIETRATETRATQPTRHERYAARERGKLQSPVDPDDADSLRALRVEPEPAPQEGAQASDSI